MDEDVRPAVDLAKIPQAAAVVIVAVGQHRNVHGAQVHAQLFRVVDEAAIRPHVEQDSVFGRLDVKAQPVGGAQPRVTGGVFH